VQVSIGYDIVVPVIDNGNGITGNSKNPNMGIFERQGETYAVIGRPSNLVSEVLIRVTTEQLYYNVFKIII
jgi:hypothetical protein